MSVTDRVAALTLLVVACSGESRAEHSTGSGGASTDAGGTAGASGGVAGAAGASGGTTSGGSGGASGGGTSTGGSTSDSGSIDAPGANADIPGGGTILFQESFDDTSFSARGWYDGSGGALTTTDPAPGSKSAYECEFALGATSCSGGGPARHPITPTETAYMSFWLKFSTNWVGSGRAYHPHMFHFINDLDDEYVGPAHTYLTTYTEVVEGRAVLALQDSKNVDLACILRNDDSFVGCNGDFASYVFTENRSVTSCNGLAGDVDGRDCFSNGDGTWYSSRSWSAGGAFVDAAGPRLKSDWHFVEAYFEMNSIEGGVGFPNGKIRWVQDGVTLIRSDRVLFRTGAHASLRFSQFAMLPYIGDGSPVTQSFFVDELTVATARP